MIELERSPSIVFPVRDYDLRTTLGSGQAFRWRERAGGWEAVVQNRWVRLTQRGDEIEARSAVPVSDWAWLVRYLQLEVELPAIVAGFPDDAVLREAVTACWGLRLLRQDPWECLASFILSSSKQIVQIQQIVQELCARFGDPVAVPEGVEPARAFPPAARLAECGEAELRDCKMGFRAPYLLETARLAAAGEIDLDDLANRTLSEARRELLRLPGVGRKIADCVLLFGYGFAGAFPVDVWVIKALRRLYFKNRPVKLWKLQGFAETHFGANGGYAQQYLFHYMRTAPGAPGTNRIPAGPGSLPSRAVQNRGNS